MKDLRHTGSVWPSSGALAKAMTRSLRSANGPKRLLEIGPGTGPFTKVALKSLRPGDEFVIVELNSAFCDELDRRLLAPYRRLYPEVRIVLHNAPIEAAPIEGQFDFIVCGLPFNNFPPPLVRAIFRRMLALLKPDGELVYFEYAGVRVLKAPLVGPRGREALKRIASYSRALRNRHGGKRQLVLGNFPPAMAVRLKAGADLR